MRSGTVGSSAQDGYMISSKVLLRCP
jgi:hypothetical protein